MSRLFYVQVSEQDPTTEATAGTLDTSTLTYSIVDWVEPLIFSDVANGEIGELRLIAAKQSTDARTLWSDARARLKQGRFVRVIDTKNNNQVIFQGVIVKHHVALGGEQFRFEAVAYQLGDYLLWRINLHGQHRLSHTLEQSYFETGLTEETTPVGTDDLIHIDTPLVFNPDGEMNMHPRDFHWKNK